MTVAIRTERLTKYYGSVVGLEDVSLEIFEGEVFGFLGPNGAGKTTTIRMLLDLVRPSDGAILEGYRPASMLREFLKPAKAAALAPAKKG